MGYAVNPDRLSGGTTPTTGSSPAASKPPSPPNGGPKMEYYPNGCGIGPYLKEMRGTMSQCSKECMRLDACTGFMRHNNYCWLDNDDDVANRLVGKKPTSMEAAAKASWHCGKKIGAPSKPQANAPAFTKQIDGARCG